MQNLLRVHGFIALVAVVFLNAFIDLGHKIIIQNTVFKIYEGSEQIVLTAIVNALILLPFILFFHVSGKTSDTHAKSNILRAASLAALFISGCISLCYWNGMFWTAFALTFFLGIQSAYYGPAKYGLLKELVSNQQLSLANGITQAMATIGILSGILFFSVLFEGRFTQISSLDSNTIIKTMAPLSWLLIAISFVECLIAWTLPTHRNIQAPQVISIKNEVQEIVKSPILFPAIIGLSVFWSVGQMLLATYPAFAKTEMGITNTVVIQGLLAAIGIGIMLGSLLAGRLSRTHIETVLIPLSGIGIILIVFLLPHITDLIPAAFMFLGIGIVGGFLIVPLNAIVQYCTPPEKLGITIANSNLMQNIAMLSCLAITMTAALFQVSAKNLLFFIAITACIGIALVIKKIPHSLLKLTSKQNKPLCITGFDNVPGNGALLILANTIKNEYRPLIQMSYPRKIEFSAPVEWTKDSCICLQKSNFNKSGLPDKINIVNANLIEKKNKILLNFT